ETLTACDLNDPRYIHLLNMIHKWVFVDHIIPSLAEKLSVSAQAGYGGLNAQLFNSGNYAMMYAGRYMLVQFRRFNKYRKKQGKKPLQLAVTESPNGGFPNCVVATRAAAIYKGASAREKKFGALFLSYLTSRKYNMTIVQDADALPPVPRYSHRKNHPYMQVFANAARNIGIATPNSPFVLTAVANMIEWRVYGRFMSGLISARQ